MNGLDTLARRDRLMTKVITGLVILVAILQQITSFLLSNFGNVVDCMAMKMIYYLYQISESNCSDPQEHKECRDEPEAWELTVKPLEEAPNQSLRYDKALRHIINQGFRSMTATYQPYNPFAKAWEFTQVYSSIIFDELTNENAQEFYAQGWDAHDEAVAPVIEHFNHGWDVFVGYALYVAAVASDLYQEAYEVLEEAVDMTNTPRFNPSPVTIAGYLPPATVEPVIDTGWIDWMQYLSLILKIKRQQE